MDRSQSFPINRTIGLTNVVVLMIDISKGVVSLACVAQSTPPPPTSFFVVALNAPTFSFLLTAHQPKTKST